MQAITVRDRDAGIGGLSLTDMPYPRAAENDVIVRVHAAGFSLVSSAGLRRGLTAQAATGPPACPGTNCRVSSPSWDMAPPA